MAKKHALMAMVVAAMLFVAAPEVIASGGELATPGDWPILVDPNAPGTKLSGPLTIYYKPVDCPESEPNCCGDTLIMDMYFFLRLKKGTTLYPFAGKASGVCFNSLEEQQDAVSAFFQSTVIPFLFPRPPGVPTPPFALKSFTQLVQEDSTECPTGETGCNSGLHFGIMEIVVAVQE